ncbi:hypothetical protein [Pseudonocardia sp. McavD-2-B]|uniref:hypothetical protein n=1 Tax=Pseudonocardia sp. McavD-2-B TaxID=2954499 RepID=UPI002096ECFE|nr:hypothetical protein [Pseudonocardia sp. McavD-2-B]MCO7195396.1 hypothetical protein [Pseudonocardia sp. McavD-2-B]
MISEPFPLPVTLTVGESGAFEVGELLVAVDAVPVVAGDQAEATVTVRAADGRAVVDNLADLLEATAGRLRAGENLLDPTEGRPADAARE